MKESLLAAGGAISAAAASTCCIVPLMLVSAGVSGAWIGNLTALAPFQPYFVAVALASLGAGFWMVYRRAPKNCSVGTYADPQAGCLIKSVLWVKAVLWLGATLVALSVGVDFGARMFM